MQLIPAFQKDEFFLSDVEHSRQDKNYFHIWWLGQSGYLLQWNGKHVLIDPYLSDSLSKKYEHTSKPHTRMSERVVDPEKLNFIDIVTSSHNHTDHLDAETLVPVIKNNPGIRFVIPEANRQFVSERIQCDPSFPDGLNDGSSCSIAPFTFYGIPARHNEIERDEKGQCRFMGYVIRFGPWTIYHSGDTLWFDEMVTILTPYNIDLALLPINGNDPRRGVAGNLNSSEAAQLAKRIRARMVIPCHYQMFTFNTADPASFAEAAQSIDQPHSILRLGEKFTSAFLP